LRLMLWNHGASAWTSRSISARERFVGLML
jgi:hypothetical protein